MTDTTPTRPVEEIQVVDIADRRRYEARIGERVLGFVTYQLDPADGRITLVHTEVLPDAEGMGVGSRLARGALEDARARGLKVTVVCPFITAYLRRHPGEYEDLVGG
jgi:predicted GNAT family acetyltransferase